MRKRSLIKTRQQRILSILRETEYSAVEDLGARLQVSPVTVRRDLDYLSERGLLVRVHGGAEIRQTLSGEVPFTEKKTTHVREKVAIGRYAASLLQDGDTLLMNGGATTLEVIRHIRRKNVRIITNNAAAINALPPNNRVELILLGGEYRQESHSLIGEVTLFELSKIFAPVVMLGTNGIDLKKGFTCSVYRESGVNRGMLEQAGERVYFLADHSKINRAAPFQTAPPEADYPIITDEGIESHIFKTYEEAGFSLIKAPFSS